jgi:serine/threonine-protein kinase
LDAWWRQGEHPLDAEEALVSDTKKTSRAWWPYAVAVAMTIAAVAVGWWFVANRESPLAVVRSALPLPADASNAVPALSPDGTFLVYSPLPRSGRPGPLHIKRIDELASHPIAGTEGAVQPFFSPDASWIGYFANGTLYKVARTGGAPIPLASARSGRGGTWLSDDTIVFSPHHLVGLSRVSAKGGEVTDVTVPNRVEMERSHRWPSAIPDSNVVLFTMHRATADTYDDADIESVDVTTGKRILVVHGGFNPSITASGHLIFGRQGKIWAAPFDKKTLQLTGNPTAVLDGVAYFGSAGLLAMTVSSAGTLVYAPGGDFAATQLLWSDRTGKQTPLIGKRASYTWARLSPDGKFLAVGIDDGVPRVWLLDLERGALTRRTQGFDAESPIWSPDGLTLAFEQDSYQPDGRPLANFVMVPRDGNDDSATILKSSENSLEAQGFDWSPDGSWIATFNRQNISLLSVTDPAKIDPILHGRDEVYAPRFSPNGRLLAYESNVAGRSEVYVMEIGGHRRRWQISTDGGAYPVWSRSGHEIYYRQTQPPLIMMSKIATTDVFSHSRPQPLFDAPPGTGNELAFDVTADGRFILISGAQDIWRTNGLVMVQNWFEELRQKVRAP